MRNRLSIAMGIGLAMCIAGSQARAEVFAYPKKGQSQEQFEQDQFQCHKWAKGQTGVDPTQPQQSAAAPPPQQGGAVRGAAKGAALGAIGGAIAGDAGKGAAIGAGVGAAGGAMKRSEEHTSELQSPTNLVCRLLL